MKEVPTSLSIYLKNCSLKQPNYSSKLDSFTHDELIYSLQSVSNTKLKSLDDKELDTLMNDPEFTGKKLDSKEIVVENQNTNEVLNELSMIIKENRLKDQLIWKELVNTIEINNKKYLEWNGLNGSINPSIKSENNETYRIPISKTLEEINKEDKSIIISDSIANITLIPFSIYKFLNNNNNNNQQLLEIHMNDKMIIELSLPSKDLSIKYNSETKPEIATVTDNITRIIMNNNSLKRINNINEIHYISINNNKEFKSVLSKDILQRCKIYSINNEDLHNFIKCMNKNKPEIRLKELYLENFLEISNQKLSLYSDIKSVLPRVNKDLNYEVNHLNKQMKSIMDFITNNVEDSNVIPNAYDKIMKECNISRVLNVENLFSRQKSICTSYDEIVSLNDRDLEEIETISFDKDEYINSTKFESLVNILPKIPNLKSIEIQKSEIVDPDLMEFAAYLKTNKNLEKLKIVSHKLSFLSFSDLLTNVNPHIKELSVSSDLYNDAVTIILNNHLPKLPDLEKLELYGFRLSASELEKVYKNVDAYCPNMKYLSLPYVKTLKNDTNPVTGRYGKHKYEIGFTDACITVPELKELYNIHPNLQFTFLECKGITDEEIRDFADYVSINKNLDHLFITEGSFNSENVNYLIDRINKSNIEVLSFKKCSFEKSEINSLCERIDEFENIDDLELENCNMNTESLSILIEKVKNLKKFRRLNIVGMKMNDETVGILKRFKTISPKYESLAIGNVSITPEIMIDLLGSELFNKTKILTLKRVDIKSYQTHKLFNGLDSMPKIEYVILDNCTTNPGMMKQIKKDLTFKYELIFPDEKSKETNWMTLLFSFLGIYFLLDYFERNDKSKNNKNKNNNTTEILPNNNDIHRIQSHNQNHYDNYNNDGNYLQNNSNNVTEEYNSTEEYSGGSTPHGFNR